MRPSARLLGVSPGGGGLEGEPPGWGSWHRAAGGLGWRGWVCLVQICQHIRGIARGCLASIQRVVGATVGGRRAWNRSLGGNDRSVPHFGHSRGWMRALVGAKVECWPSGAAGHACRMVYLLGGICSLDVGRAGIPAAGMPSSLGREGGAGFFDSFLHRQRGGAWEAMRGARRCREHAERANAYVGRLDQTWPALQGA
jgi:hypothetical protein